MSTGTLHDAAFGSLNPSGDQVKQMSRLRLLFTDFAEELDMLLPSGPDKTYVMRQLRDCAMWSNQCILRNPDGSPRGWSDSGA